MATTPAQWSRPISTGWPGLPSYDARAQAPAPDPAAAPADDVGRDVGQVDQGDQRGLVAVPVERREPGAQRGAHAVGPVGGDDLDVDAGVGEQRAASSARGAEHHGHAVAAGRSSESTARVSQPSTSALGRPIRGPAPAASSRPWLLIRGPCGKRTGGSIAVGWCSFVQRRPGRLSSDLQRGCARQWWGGARRSTHTPEHA